MRAEIGKKRKKAYGDGGSGQKDHCCNSDLYTIWLLVPAQDKKPMLTVFIATLSCFISSAISWDLNAISLDVFASSCVARSIACIFSPFDTINRSFAI